MDLSRTNKNQRGIALPEVAIAITVLMTVIFGIVEIGRLLWTVNTLVDATRRGARYAVVNPLDVGKVQNMVVYGSPTGGTTPAAYGLSTTNVSVDYSADFGLGSGQVTVSIINYSFDFVIP